MLSMPFAAALFAHPTSALAQTCALPLQKCAAGAYGPGGCWRPGYSVCEKGAIYPPGMKWCPKGALGDGGAYKPGYAKCSKGRIDPIIS